MSATEKPTPSTKEMIPADPEAVFAIALHLAMNDKKELLEKLIAELKPAPPARTVSVTREQFHKITQDYLLCDEELLEICELLGVTVTEEEKA